MRDDPGGYQTARTWSYHVSLPDLLPSKPEHTNFRNFPLLSITKIDVVGLLALGKDIPILDVRSPSEYSHAHIPGAVSFPLFTDEERKAIGTAYKQESRRQAIRIGLEPFGKNLVKMIDSAEALIPGREVLVHCWRGGMRSAAVAWLLDLYGYRVYVLAGGYKSYRRWALEQFERPYDFGIVGGYTGSNKTGLLQELHKAGEYVIDLEALAGHKGSAFGNLERLPQPSQEQFENELALALHGFSAHPTGGLIWIEQEDQRIGQINLPGSFFDFFSQQTSYFLEVPFEARLRWIVAGYGKHSRESLINAIVRIKRRLGGLEAKAAVSALLDDDVTTAFRILLQYYDRLYGKHLAKRKDTLRTVIPCESTDGHVNLKLLYNHVGKQD